MHMKFDREEALKILETSSTDQPPIIPMHEIR
jgi:hypothetical protein